MLLGNGSDDAVQEMTADVFLFDIQDHPTHAMLKRLENIEEL